MAQGTLHNYSENKRESLLAIANETQAPMEPALMTGAHIQDRTALVDLMDHALDIPPDQLAFMRTIWGEAWIDDQLMDDFAVIRLGRIHHPVTALIRERVDHGIIRAAHPELTAQMIIGIFVAVILPVVRGIRAPANTFERRTLAAAMEAMILDGIQAR